MLLLFVPLVFFPCSAQWSRVSALNVFIRINTVYNREKLRSFTLVSISAVCHYLFFKKKPIVTIIITSNNICLFIRLRIHAIYMTMSSSSSASPSYGFVFTHAICCSIVLFLHFSFSYKHKTIFVFVLHYISFRIISTSNYYNISSKLLIKNVSVQLRKWQRKNENHLRTNNDVIEIERNKWKGKKPNTPKMTKNLIKKKSLILV